MYEATVLAFGSNTTETDEADAAYAAFDAKKNQLGDMYSDHRRKAKVVFHDDLVTAKKLEISGSTANALIPEVKALRAVYLKEKGESEDATSIKDSAFAKLDEWMREFYSIAKIAMEDNPQLLEALSLTVKR